MNPILIGLTAAVILMSAVCFFLMYRDKRLARKGGRRIPEKTLFLTAALFGATGGTAGMLVFRHKTKHWYFKLFFPLMMAVQLAALIYAFTALK